ncbi:MAG TPA: hypothetical protein VIO60_10840, partial [Rectinemataceae bacterium]
MIRSNIEAAASKAELEEIGRKALSIRLSCLESLATLGVGHIGGSMSVVEILAMLYFRHLRIDADDSRAPDRDIFVL